MHAKVQDGDEKQQSTRGASLRELQLFFREHDKNGGYAGLRRVGADDGTAIWTKLDDNKIEEALDDRAKERRAEESRLRQLLESIGSGGGGNAGSPASCGAAAAPAAGAPVNAVRALTSEQGPRPA